MTFQPFIDPIFSEIPLGVLVRNKVLILIILLCRVDFCNELEEGNIEAFIGLEFNACQLDVG